MQLADALPKLQGLALYPEKHAEAHRRIESVVEAKEKVHVLDLTSVDIRKGISASTSAESLFAGALAMDY